MTLVHLQEDKITTDTFWYHHDYFMMKPIEFKGIPAIRILDYKTAIEFYVHFLGFTINWEHRIGPTNAVYMRVSRNGLVLYLSENKKFPVKGMVFVDTKELEKFRCELLNRNTNQPIPKVLVTKLHTKHLEVEDPFGNILRFNEVGV